MSTIEVLKWITAAASLWGVILNLRKDRRCFYIWSCTNAAWAVIDAAHGIWAQSALQATYCGLALWGIRTWKKGGDS